MRGYLKAITLKGKVSKLEVVHGKDGLTPYIGENGNWWIGEEDTGVSASRVYIANYNETTNAEIFAARKAGKLVFAQDGGDSFLFPACMITETNAHFVCDTGYKAFKMMCTNDVWSAASMAFEDTSNRVKVIDENSTDSEYPTAKAVEDRVKNLGNATDTIAGVAITEAADGTVTMVNTLSSGETETIIVSADAEGNPNGLSYNGVAIPFSYTKEVSA